MARNNLQIAKDALRQLHAQTTLKTKWNAHYYVVGKEAEYPSVTTMLKILDKSGLLGWSRKLAREKFTELTGNVATMSPDLARAYFDEAMKEADNVRDAAAEKGTAIHAAIEHALTETAGPETGAEQRQHMENALAYMDKHGLTPVSAEQRIWCKPKDSPGFGGMVDCIARDLNGGLHVIDWKTGNSLYETHDLQVSAYAFALETHHIPVSACHVVLTKDGSSSVTHGLDVLRLGMNFLHVSRLYGIMRKNKKMWLEPGDLKN